VSPPVSPCCYLAEIDHRGHRASRVPTVQAIHGVDFPLRYGAAASAARKSVGVSAKARTAWYLWYVHDNPSDLRTADQAAHSLCALLLLEFLLDWQFSAARFSSRKSVRVCGKARTVWYFRYVHHDSSDLRTADPVAYSLCVLFLFEFLLDWQFLAAKFLLTDLLSAAAHHHHGNNTFYTTIHVAVVAVTSSG